MNSTGTLVVLSFLFCVSGERQVEGDDVLDACRSFLTDDADEQSDSAALIREYQGDVDDVLRVLSRPAAAERHDVSGVIASQAFTEPGLKSSYEDDLLHYFVPDGYTPGEPAGLLIFMHGGGRTTPRDHPLHVVTHPDDDPKSLGLQPHFHDVPFIIVAPSAPWNEKTGARWNVPEADAYIPAVIEECCYRFNIDRDRVILGGYSMGGFGALHLGQRLADRLAGGFVFSGAWKTMHWKAWTGLPLFLRHGADDAHPRGLDGTAGRPRFTDVFYSRTAHQRMKELGLPHVYVEDEGDHTLKEAGEALSKMADWVQKQKRDPYSPHVVAVSPRGWKASTDTPTPHQKWITIHETGAGTINFDSVVFEGPSPSFQETREAFFKQSLRVEPSPVQAGLVEARLTGENRIVIQTENVRRFSVWLHPSMVDFSQPVTISLNGIDSEHVVQARLLDALRSYRRRQDWGLIYHAELTLNCNK